MKPIFVETHNFQVSKVNTKMCSYFQTRKERIGCPAFALFKTYKCAFCGHNKKWEIYHCSKKKVIASKRCSRVTHVIFRLANGYNVKTQHRIQLTNRQRADQVNADYRFNRIFFSSSSSACRELCFFWSIGNCYRNKLDLMYTYVCRCIAQWNNIDFIKLPIRNIRLNILQWWREKSSHFAGSTHSSEIIILVTCY